MRDLIGPLASILHREKWHYYVRHWFVSLSLWFGLVVASIAFVLAKVGQIHEFYNDLLTSPELDILAVVAALVLALLFSFLLFAMVRAMPEFYDPRNAFEKPPTSAMRVRNASAYLIPLLPWAGLYLGLVEADLVMKPRLVFLEADISTYLSRMAFAKGMVIAAAMALLLLLVGWDVFARNGKPVMQINQKGYMSTNKVMLWGGWFIKLAIICLTVYLLLDPWLGFTDVARSAGHSPWSALGPVATMFAVFIAFFGAIFAIGRLFSSIGASDLVIVFLVFIAASLLFDKRSEIEKRAPGQRIGVPETDCPHKPAKSLANLSQVFKAWFKSRCDRKYYKRKAAAYPVYVIAMQGGGAYAASHAAQFMASLQDANPRFAEHVFAISGVSGGAVGATLFTAINAALPASEKGAQSREFGEGPRAQILRQILTGRHTVPLIAEIPGTLFLKTSRKIGEFLGVRHLFRRADGEIDRAASLRESYIASVRYTLLGKRQKSTSERALAYLNGEMETAWSPRSRIPALILNATSVETGQQIALMPSKLNHLSNHAITPFSQWFDGTPPPITVLDAAIVSARFPGILPAYSNDRAEGRTNLVDGGYADSSGATSAHVLFQKLEKIAKANPRMNVELKLILLVNDTHIIQNNREGTSLVDVLAPVIAMLKVRDLQAQRAVAQIREAFHANKRQNLQLIKLPLSDLGLPLAWGISKITYDAISASIGRPTHCEKSNPDGLKQAVSARDIAGGNSCKIAEILSSLPPS